MCTAFLNDALFQKDADAIVKFPYSHELIWFILEIIVC